MDFTNGASLAAYCKAEGCTIHEAMLHREIEQTAASQGDIMARLATAYDIMKASVQSSLTEELHSMGGLIGGEAKTIMTHISKTETVCGRVSAKAVAYAMGVLEVNAAMGLIVAAPTAGSSGIIPGVFLALQEEFKLSEQAMLNALLCASAVGYICTRNATVAGAEGGCQAEVGVASAMAAAAVTEAMGGDAEASLSAAAMTLSNLLGLVCDPVAGLVESPCQTRNAIGAANALICAEIALSGVKNLIPFDEMTEAMYRVGKSLPPSLRETAQGGCATTPTGCALRKKIFK
ncbi:MAG: L-serine ammonia-lyase, iron-sulfur-dependent, subunit alpha [Hydrogenoanaerobacterium sp.]